MDGTITVESEPSKGSVFKIRLPFEIVEAGDLLAAEDLERASMESDSGVRTPFPRDDKPSVLIADDDVSVRSVLCDLLSVLECSVTSASDGQQAIHLAETQKFDLIFMDVNMPVLGGLEATQAIRRESLNTETPIIGLSGNSLGSDVVLAEKRGMTAYLTKPCKLSMLSDAVQKHTAPRPTTEGLQLSVLLVDDDPNNRSMLHDMVALVAPDVTTTEATNGVEAVTQAEQLQFDIIFMDLMMPEMNGMEATRIIRSGSLNQTTPIICLSGHTNADSIAEALMSGMTAHLAKPYALKDIERILTGFTGVPRSDNSPADTAYPDRVLFSRGD
eukprot:TRINITY_DN4213_c0_g1_i2.p1 TRINITY_DN4213_c0_g1~~TRINITY_DN4213_c0_g1_i2.p1  ORF type:complete len:330 (-),score=68.78 TRINITY_DN4213_c0_g1_i2:185-1174(-)